VTVNDYLSKSHPYWMGPIYHALGMTGSSIQGQQTAGVRWCFFLLTRYDTGKEEICGTFQADYSPGSLSGRYYLRTNNEFGFDYSG